MFRVIEINNRRIRGAGDGGSLGVWEVQGYAAAAAAYAPSRGNKGIFVSRGEGALTVRNSQYFWASDPNCELSNHVSAEAVSFAWLNISTEMIQTSPTVYTARHLGCWNILGWLMCPFSKRADLQEEGLLKEADLYLKAYTLKKNNAKGVLPNGVSFNRGHTHACRRHVVQQHLIKRFGILKLPQSELWSAGWWYDDAVRALWDLVRMMSPVLTQKEWEVFPLFDWLEFPAQLQGKVKLSLVFYGV